MSPPMLDFALAYAELGWHIIPCHTMRDKICSCGKLQCTSPAKHPHADLVPNGLTQATTDPDVIRHWWSLVPDANIGVVMEPSGLVAFDVDQYHGDTEKLAVLEGQYGPLPVTTTQVSGSGDGWHIAFESPGFPVRGVIGGVVVRSKAYIIVAPSLHVSGGRYSWPEGLGPSEIETAELPDAWKEALRKTAEVGAVGVPTEEPEWLARIPQERRVFDMRAHLMRELGEVKGQSAPGTSFNAIRVAVRLYGVRDPEAALEAAQEYDKKCVPPWGARIARHVWSAYNKANEPQWGIYYRDALVHAEVKDVEIEAALESISGSRSNDPRMKLDKKMVKAVLNRDNMTVTENAALCARALVEHAPKGATDEQLAKLLIASFVPDDKARELIVRARPSPFMDFIDSLPLSEIAVPGPRIDAPDSPIALATLCMSEGDRELMGRLRMRGEDEGPDSNPSNIQDILVGDSEVGGQIRFNELLKRVEITTPRFAGKSDNVIATEIMNWLDRKWKVTTKRTAVEDQLLLVARDNPYNPIKEYLLARAALWDGISRADTWLIDYCGAEDCEFNRRAGSMWLISACARGIKPGSKVDTVLVLEGVQGAKKSTALAKLAGKWFSDSPLVIGNKDSLQMASYRWIIELAELASLQKSETEAQKAFLAASVDNYRPPYGKAPEEFPRFAVFGGSTNADQYLPDQTGNRRYLPCRVDRCDTIGLLSARDQLWSEAAHRYLSSEVNPHLAHPECPGERWWFETEAEKAMHAVVVGRRTPENIWGGLIRNFTRTQQIEVGIGSGRPPRTYWTVAELAKEAIGLDREKMPSRQKQIAEACKDAGLVMRVVNDVTYWCTADTPYPLPEGESLDQALHPSN